MDQIGYAIVSENYDRLDNIVYHTQNEALEAVNGYLRNGYSRHELKVHYGYTLNPSEYVTEDSDKKDLIARINESLEWLTDSYKLRHITKDYYQKKKKILSDQKKLIKSNKFKWVDSCHI
mgnify:CR=1 FL=1